MYCHVLRRELTVSRRSSIFTECLQVPTSRVEARLTSFFWRGRPSRPAPHRPSPGPWLSLLALRPALQWPRQRGATQARTLPSFNFRSYTTSSPRPEQQATRPRALIDQRQQIPIAVPTYESSPAFYGINGWDGYEPFISPGTRLPVRKSVRLESALDYIGQDTMQVCGFMPNTRLRVRLAGLALHGIRRARKEETTMEAVMVLRPDLTGTFTAHFTPQDGTESAKVSVAFHGGQVLKQVEDGDALATIDAGSFHVIEGCLPR